MVSSFRIAVELGDLLPDHPLTAEAFPNLAHAVRVITQLAHERWQQYASGHPLPDGQIVNPRSGTYARSIVVREVGPFSAAIETFLPYAKAIEEGAPARDGKRILGSSLKVRLTKDGRRYLIIPFRHDTPGTAGQENPMPTSVHEWWQSGERERSHVVSQHLRPNQIQVYDMKTRQLVHVPGWRYQWGTRLGAEDTAGMGITGQQAKRLEGMYNFRAPGAKGGASHSSYVTFRTMVEGGKSSWMIPATPAKHVARQTAEQIRPLAEEAFRAAVAADVRRIIGG